ncbi:MAG: SDR family NAD(P)-dependent oxidoreductase [Acidobacteriaceae bacterium]
MSKILANKVAVITGGSRGFGLAVARAYIQEGASVLVASRSQKSVDLAVDQLRKLGGRAEGATCDVSQRHQVHNLAIFALQTFGHFDVWVNNAGLSAPYGPTVMIDPDEFVRVVNTNILGTYYGSIYAMRHFLDRDQGKLINVLGRGHRQPAPLQNAYGSSKAWINQFTLALAAEYRHSGIGIFAFNPGMMETDLLEKVEVLEGYEERLKIFETIRHMWSNQPEVPAQKAVWLASSATDGKTGLKVNVLNPVRLLSGVIREGLRRLLGRPGPSLTTEITSVPAQLPNLNSDQGAA